MRTQTANGQQNSVSSHQYSTPLAVTSGVDDPVNFSSPSALLALGGYTGISPSPAVHDGLGTSMNESDIQNLGMQGLKLGVARDNDEEQRHRIDEVVQLLRARVSGRGVSRESVERLSRLEGFESIWQDDNLNIAGNFVDLEVEFYPGLDVVKDVSLRYATPEFTEGVRRDKATAVLKRTLAQSPEDAEIGKWRSLQEFHENLQWLAKLDKLSQEVNCFEALENLEENFKRIWVEESKNEKHGGEYQHLCTGVLGRPRMHKGTRIGLGLEYWVEQAKVLDAKNSKQPSDAMEIDEQQDHESKIELEDQSRSWAVMVECEVGYPSLRISKEWVGNEAFTAGESNESLPSNGAAGSVNWLDPPQTRMHKGTRIGLGLEYWVEQAKVLDAKNSKQPSDAMEIDEQQDHESKIELEDQSRSWAVMVECEVGYPSLRISKEWVGNEAFTAGESNESLPSNGAAGSVNWLDPPQTMRLTHGNHDPMAMDSSMLESSPPNRRFVAKLEPALDVPILAASEIYRHLGMQLQQQDFKMVTYDALLVSDSSSMSPGSSPHPGRRKRQMQVLAVDSKGEQQTKQHNYTFQAFESSSGLTVNELPFSHPRQLADILPVCCGLLGFVGIYTDPI